MITFILCASVGVVAFTCGTIWGRKLEQKAVAKALAGFAVLDADARSLVNRTWAFLSHGTKAELTKLLGR